MAIIYLSSSEGLDAVQYRRLRDLDLVLLRLFRDVAQGVAWRDHRKPVPTAGRPPFG